MERYLCAMIWMGLLTCFTYGELILNFVDRNGMPFEEKVLESHASSLMVLANIGLVAMLYVDKLITHFITKQHNKSQYIDVILMINIVVAVIISVVAQMTTNGSFTPVSWFKLSYLLLIFIILLVIYKAETLKIRHISSDGDILPTKNK